MPHEDLPPKYPDALSAKYREGERGFTFLHRVFRKNIDSGQPVVISVKNMYFRYHYTPGHTTFEEGITILEGIPNSETATTFMSIVRKFSLDQAIAEGGYRKQADGTLAK